MPIPDPSVEAIRLLCTELHPDTASGAVPQDAAELERDLERALGAYRAGALPADAFWRLVAEADTAIDDARRALAQRVPPCPTHGPHA